MNPTESLTLFYRVGEKTLTIYMEFNNDLPTFKHVSINDNERLSDFESFFPLNEGEVCTVPYIGDNKTIPQGWSYNKKVTVEENNP